MKKIICVACLAVMIWGCAKKMAPAQTGSSNTGNSGSVYTNNTKPTTDPGMAKGTAPAGSATTTPDPALAGSAGARSVGPTATSPEAKAVIAGQSTFNTKCGTCHGLKVTTNYTSDRWASILAIMAPKANLTEDEKNNVYAYVKENSKK